jgi:hypothetical protein
MVPANSFSHLLVRRSLPHCGFQGKKASDFKLQ